MVEESDYEARRGAVVPATEHDDDDADFEGFNARRDRPPAVAGPVEAPLNRGWAYTNPWTGRDVAEGWPH